MLTQQIGNFNFLDLRGGVQLLRQETERLVRPGVAGQGLKLTGVRGKPFSLRSVVDAPNIGYAEDFYYGYLNLVGNGPQQLIQHSLDYLGAYGYAALVLDVEQALVKRSLLTIGGLNPPSLGWLECVWHLVMVQVNQEGGDQ